MTTTIPTHEGEAPMPKTETPEALRERAASLAAQAAEAQAVIDRIAMEEYQREQDAQAERDRATVAAYSVRELDSRVGDTYSALMAAIEDMPVTQALAAHLTAINARSWAYADVTAALSRLGRPTDGMRYPNTTQPVLIDVMVSVAGRMAQDATDADRASKGA